MSIYNTAVKMLDRARVIHLDENTPVVDWAAVKASCDAVIVCLGGMDRLEAGSRVLYADKLSAQHIQGAYDNNLPVFGLWRGHPDWYLRNERTLKAVETTTVETDEMLKPIIDTWKIGAWNYATIKSTDAFRRLHGFFFSDLYTDAWNGVIDPLWHRATVFTTLVHMHEMIAHYRLPDIPIGYYALPSIVKNAVLADGSRPLDVSLYNNRDWAYLYYAQWVGTSQPQQLVKLSDVFTAHGPADSVSWLYIPPGMENRILLHEFSGEFYSTAALRSSAGIDQKVRACLFQDTKAALYTLLNYNVQQPPQPCPAGQHRDASGNCVPDEPAPCPAGQHRDAAGNCVPDVTVPPSVHTIDEVYELELQNNALLRALGKHFTTLP